MMNVCLCGTIHDFSDKQAIFLSQCGKKCTGFISDLNCSNFSKNSALRATRSLQDRRLPCKNSTLILLEFDAYLARIRRLSCKSSTLILQESYKIDAYLARILQDRRLSCKILQDVA